MSWFSNTSFRRSARMSIESPDVSIQDVSRLSYGSSLYNMSLETSVNNKDMVFWSPTNSISSNKNRVPMGG